MSEVSAFFVRNWQFTLVLFAGLAVFGANSLLTIARAEDPAFPIPVYVVRVVLPGAGPAEIEKLVSKPIEDAINGVSHQIVICFFISGIFGYLHWSRFHCLGFWRWITIVDQ